MVVQLAGPKPTAIKWRSQICPGREKNLSCKTTMKNVNLARIWQKNQILQESCKIFERIASAQKFLQDLHHCANKNPAANWDAFMTANKNLSTKQNLKPLFVKWDLKHRTNFFPQQLWVTAVIASNCIGCPMDSKQTAFNLETFSVVNEVTVSISKMFQQATAYEK